MGLLPSNVRIIGYARSKMTHDELVARVGGKIVQDPKGKAFFDLCSHVAGSYDGADDYVRLNAAIEAAELALGSTAPRSRNRLFYLAIPPSLFAQVAKNIRAHLFSGDGGWNRLVVEKPFGRDLETFLDLDAQMRIFNESELFRIDHYLGKEMVQNLIVLRFANAFMNPLWNRHHIASITITFKEPIDVEGRGGYFDEFGIIRDVMQNHLLQIFALVAMEPPVSLEAEDVRDEKTKVLRATSPVTRNDVVIGQYATDGTHEGYLDHFDVPKDSVTPTFAAAVLRVTNDRWRGVPFFLKCGKALNERKAEVRVQFRDASPLFPHLARNELVVRVQPDEAIYLKTHSKVPGLETVVAMRELDLTYSERFPGAFLPDAYERLIYDVLRGDHNLFVRNDELLASWQIFTPLLHELDRKEIKPVPYKFGSRGPAEADDLLARNGYIYSDLYEWKKRSKM
jgi:glucose-6-phosphate 1-dehydrogenase